MQIYRAAEEAVRKGFKIAEELKFTSRKTNAFADDTNCGVMRDPENIIRLVNVLIDFGRISGLETNIEKTTIMPVGCLNIPLNQEITDIGFEIVTKMKSLGIFIDNKCENLTDHFEMVKEKII